MIESFTFDHTKIARVPYVRLSASIDIGGTHRLKKFDIRFTAPNREYLTAALIHTVEHIFSIELFNWCEGAGLTYVDFSPMGCQTGFYFSFVHENGKEEVDGKAVARAVEGASIALCAYEDVPHANEKECGNCKMFDLSAAKKLCSVLYFTEFEASL